MVQEHKVEIYLSKAVCCKMEVPQWKVVLENRLDVVQVEVVKSVPGVAATLKTQ